MILVGRFKWPAGLPAAGLERLEAALAGLPERQKRLAGAAPGVGIAHTIRRVEGAFEVEYEVPRQATSAATLIGGARPGHGTLLSCARQLCAVLSCAYPEGQPAVLGHGGLCADAVLLDHEDRVTILHFGVADCFAEVLGPENKFRLTHAPGYVAPEVWNDPSKHDRRSEIFAVGVVLYELAIGGHPFGAIRDDPEDCRHQLLIEVPVPPKQREPRLGEAISQIIYKCIRPDPQSRFQTFQEMQEALRQCEDTPPPTPPGRGAQPPAIAGQLADHAEAVEGTPQDLDAQEQADRQLYLQKQARLRQQREESERRQAHRREQLASVRRELRRHAIAVCAALVIVLGAGGSILVWRARTANREHVSRQVAALITNLNAGMQRDAPEQVLSAMGLSRPARQLVRAVADLRKMAPEAEFRSDDPSFGNVLCSRGTIVLHVEESQVPIQFELPGNGETSLQLRVDEAALTAHLIQTVDTLARARIDPRVDPLIRQYGDLFRQSRTAAEVEARMPGLLGYVTWRGESKKLETGPFKPVPGESAVETELAMFDHRGEEISQVRPMLRLGFECNGDPDGEACRATQFTVTPQEEPLDHRQWCMALAAREVAAAFEARNAERLTEATGGGRIDTSRQTLAWAGECRSARLVLGPIDVESASVSARISYVPGILSGSEREFITDPIELRFDAGREWRIRSGSTVWPAAPDPLLRQELGSALLAELREALRSRDAARYLALFEGAPHHIDDVRRMFSTLEPDLATFEATSREDEDSATTLYVHVRPAAGSAHVAKTFEFDLTGGRLRWNPRSDSPAWVVARAAYRDFSARLIHAGWSEIDSLRNDFEAAQNEAMSVDEQARIRAWLNAIDSARALFEPLSDDYVGGFPRRVRLKQAGGGSIELRLIDPPGSSELHDSVTNVLYMQESEVRVSHIEPLWAQRRADRPWDTWARIVGAPPAGQAVGLKLTEAEALARELGCELPTLAEWQSATATLKDEHSMNFQGGVWEWCSDKAPNGQSQIVGGCWLDTEPEVSAVTRFAESLPAPTHFGTIGFRLCKRFTVPSAGK